MPLPLLNQLKVAKKEAQETFCFSSCLPDHLNPHNTTCTLLRAGQNKLLVSQIKYFPLELLTYFLILSSILEYFLIPGRQVPFLVREGLGPKGPYSNYAYAATILQIIIFKHSLQSQ